MTSISDKFKSTLEESDLIYLQEVASGSEILTEEIIPLLEERLTVNFTQRKVSEIVVRKEIETQIVTVEVPIRREKLIIEQVSPEYKQLAEIKLGETLVADIELPNGISKNAQPLLNNNKPVLTNAIAQDSQPTVSGKFNSTRVASDLLDTIARTLPHDCLTVRIEIVLKDSKHQDTYQAWFDRFGSTKISP
jgi:hypothetical protein